MSQTDDQQSPPQASADTNPTDDPVGKPAIGRRRSIIRLLIMGMMLVGLVVGGIELWTYQSYRTTVAELNQLLDTADSRIALDDAKGKISGWHKSESDISTFREDITIRWVSLLGEYWIRIHATKSTDDQPEQYFTGFKTGTDKPPQVDVPTKTAKTVGNPSGLGSRTGGQKKRVGKRSKTTSKTDGP